jgi:CHAD domain-containing protein
MAYRFKRGESVPDAARRIAREELKSVVDQLGENAKGNRDEAIHEARKSIKKVRALMRLLQKPLGSRYQRENRKLRKVARTLSELRDAGAMVEVFDTLRKEYPDELGERQAASVRRALLQRKKQAEEHADLPCVLQGISKSVEAAARRAKRWSVQANSFSAVEPGLKQTFHALRVAFAKAQRHPHPDRDHEWRKRVKDHWYHIRLLEDLWTDVLQGYEASLKDLETWLGDSHNLVLLRDLLASDAATYADKKTVDRTLRAIDRFQKDLHDKADALGRRICEEKPAQFTRRMRKLWQDWKVEPKSVVAFEKQRRKDQAA